MNEKFQGIFGQDIHLKTYYIHDIIKRQQTATGNPKAVTAASVPKDQDPGKPDMATPTEEG